MTLSHDNTQEKKSEYSTRHSSTVQQILVSVMSSVSESSVSQESLSNNFSSVSFNEYLSRRAMLFTYDFVILQALGLSHIRQCCFCVYNTITTINLRPFSPKYCMSRDYSINKN